MIGRLPARKFARRRRWRTRTHPCGFSSVGRRSRSPSGGFTPGRHDDPDQAARRRTSGVLGWPAGVLMVPLDPYRWVARDRAWLAGVGHDGSALGARSGDQGLRQRTPPLRSVGMTACPTVLPEPIRPDRRDNGVQRRHEVRLPRHRCRPAALSFELGGGARAPPRSRRRGARPR